MDRWHLLTISIGHIKGYYDTVEEILVICNQNFLLGGWGHTSPRSCVANLLMVYKFSITSVLFNIPYNSEVSILVTTKYYKIPNW